MVAPQTISLDDRIARLKSKRITGAPANVIPINLPAQVGTTVVRSSDELEADARQAKKFLGEPTSKRFDETVRRALRHPVANVHVHSCPKKILGEGACNCKSIIPFDEAQKLVLKGEARWDIVTRADGSECKVSRSIVLVADPDFRLLPHVRVHACANSDGQLPERCYCSHHLCFDEAQALIEQGRAEWLTVDRAGVEYPLHTALVLTADEVEERDAALRKLARPKGKPIAKFRAALLKAVADGMISKADAELTDTQIWHGFRNPDTFCAEHPNLFPNGFEWQSYISSFRCQQYNIARTRCRFSKLLLQCTNWYWNEMLLRSGGLDMDDSGAPRSSVPLVTGGYDTIADKTFDFISTYNREKKNRGSGKTWRARPLRPRGRGPDRFEREDTTGENRGLREQSGKYQ